MNMQVKSLLIFHGCTSDGSFQRSALTCCVTQTSASTCGNGVSASPNVFRRFLVTCAPDVPRAILGLA